MSVELATAPTGPSDIIPFSNVTLVRSLEGELSVFVGSQKILGAGGIQITANGVLAFAIPMTRVRLAESLPVMPVYEYKDNVVPFNKLVAVDDTPSTDGDAA